MSFASPWAWLWLSSLIPVLILHFLRRREREYPVSALFLWEGIRPDRPHFLERLRRRFDLLLLLQVLAVFLFSSALSQPFLRTQRPSGATLLVLDGSASASREGVAEEIVSQAREIIARSAGPWAILLWADPPEVLCGRTSSVAEAHQALSRFQPRLTRRPELAQVLALLPEPWPRIVVITDNPAGVTGAEVVQVPRPENLALTAFSVRPSPDGTRYEAFLRILNDTSAFKDVQVRVRTAAGEYWASRLVPPGEEEIVVLPISGMRESAFVAELSPMDSFPWDNVRYFAFSSGEVRVLWRGEEDRYLWAALRAAAPAVRVSSSPDLVVAYSTELKEDPLGPAFLVGTGTPGFPKGKLREAGPIRGEAHPVLNHVSLSQFRVGKVWESAIPVEAQVVLWAGDLPLLALWEGPYGRWAFLTADLRSSNFPLLPDFPILIRNILGWLLPEEPPSLLMVGEALRLPEGFSVVVEGEEVEGLWVPEKPGFYELRRPHGKGFLAVNVPWEASAPVVFLAQAPPAPQLAEVSLPLWPWVLLALLPLLLGEALLFARQGG